jgi:uncharacterized membrane protein YdjX (TVP38/TMEM64 family)
MFKTDKNKPDWHDSPWFWVATCAGIAALALAAWIFDLKALHGAAQSMNGLVLFVVTALLPLAGVPVSVLYIAVGARFGHAWGMVLVAGAIVVHLSAAWWIGHSWLKRPLVAILRRFGKKKPQVPAGESVATCLLIALMPGISYALKNYVLVLAGAPFRQFFWTCLPVHLFTASLGVLFGGFTASMTPVRILFLLAYGASLLGLSRYLFRRLARKRQRTQDQRAPSASDQGGPA